MKRRILVLAGGLGYLSAATGSLAAAPDGATLFRQRCAACHSTVSGARQGLGPNLAGVVGRKAGLTDFPYSPALKGATITWSKANLDRYLTGPTKMVPGTRMAIVLSDPQMRKAVIDHLAKPK